MSHQASTETDHLQAFKHLTRCGDGAPPMDEKVLLLQMLRSDKAAGPKVDRLLLEEIERLRIGLEKVQNTQGDVRELLDRFRDAPWHPATFLGLVNIDGDEAALVMQGNTRRAVVISEDFDPEGLQAGDEVLLGNQMNLVVARSPMQSFRSGETATFDRLLPDGRLVIQHRDEEVVLEAAGRLASSELRAGDRIRWDRTAWIAYEKLSRSEGRHLFVEDTPADKFDEIGGLDREIEQIQQSIHLHVYRQDIVQKYKARRRGSILLVGPPGNGKTKTARALANWMAGIAKSGRSHFINIKPGTLNSMWFGQTEANYREAFRTAREASELEKDVPVIVFIDEIDSIGAARGASLMRVDDRVLTSFMAELDGFEDRGNVLVVAATNRRDALDPALLRPGRLGDLVIEIPRPNRKAAAAIFDRYLRRGIPYARDGHGDDLEATRLDIIQTALSRIFAPNSDNRLATLTFRDGKQIAVTAKDLISGAGISKIVQAAVERACFREIQTGEPGVSLSDVLTAIHEEFQSASRVLTPANCHKHLSTLPQDVDVVRVDLPKHKGPRHRYIATA